MRRLVHLRWGLHHPIKKVLAEDYCKWFENSRFAKLFGPAGTTSRLDAWCKSLACCINERAVNPEKTAAIFQILDAPSVCQKIGEKTAFGRVLVDNRSIRSAVLQRWHEAQELYEQEAEAEDMAPDVETVAAQFASHGLIERHEDSYTATSGTRHRSKSPGASRGLNRNVAVSQPFTVSSQVAYATGHPASPRHCDSLMAKGDKLRPYAPNLDNPMPPELQTQQALLPTSSHAESLCQLEAPSTNPAPAVLGLPLESPHHMTDFDLQDEFENLPRLAAPPIAPTPINVSVGGPPSSSLPLIELESQLQHPATPS